MPGGVIEVARKLVSGLVAGLVGLTLSACGGGGGGDSGGGGTPPGSGGSAPSPTGFSAVFTPATENASTITGYPEQVPYAATLSYSGSGALYLVAEYDSSLVSAFSGTVNGNILAGQISFRPDVAPGSYSSKIILHACVDTKCANEVSGSPVTLPVKFSVSANIQVQGQVSLSRSGTDPAPSIALAVSIPREAVSVAISSTGATDVISAALNDSTLNITTTQARAGTYPLQIVLKGSADPRYLQTVNVSYVVSPPVGGEQPLSSSPRSLDLFLAQSATPSSQTITVTPPTWTSDPVTARLVDTTGRFSLSPGPAANQYTLGINPNGMALGYYDAGVAFDAGATGGTSYLPITMYVTGSFYAAGTFNPINLDANSTLATLQVVSPVITVDGTSATWTASSQSNWLSISPGSGATGNATPLTASVNFALLDSTAFNTFGSFTLATDQPGAQPATIQVAVTNNLPWLQRTNAVLVGTAGRLYVDGDIAGNLLRSGKLQVSGATLDSASYRTDTRFVGDSSVLALDVSGATPGQAIIISANTPLVSSQLRVAVQAPAQLTAAYQALPFGSYRPSRYAPGLDAFYFSAPDTVYRWGQSGGASWALSQASFSGLSGVALRQDEQRLYASSGNTLLALDPTTLTQIAVSPPLSVFGASPLTTSFDGSGPSYLASMAHSSDGRTYASTMTPSVGQPATRGLPWVASSSGTRVLADLVDAPRQADPGWPALLQTASSGIGVVASPSAHVIVGSGADGRVSIYEANRAFWASGPVLASGVYVVGTSDTGQMLVASDGNVLQGGSNIGNLNAVLPLSEYAGGFGVTQDGRYALVYSYQIATANGPASNAVLRIVDLTQAPATPLSAAAVLTSVSLSSPVGCTVTPLASGETCQHIASITLAPGSDTAFVLGPRGIARAPLPSSLAVQTASVLRKPEAARSTARKAPSTQLWRPVATLLVK